MSMITVESPGRIAKTHPVRKAFSDCSGYYEDLVEAIRTFSDVLQCWPFHLDREDYYDIDRYGSKGKVSITDDYGRKFGNAYFTWDKVPGGGWEVSGCIS